MKSNFHNSTAEQNTGISQDNTKNIFFSNLNMCKRKIKIPNKELSRTGALSSEASDVISRKKRPRKSNLLGFNRIIENQSTLSAKYSNMSKQQNLNRRVISPKYFINNQLQFSKEDVEKLNKYKKHETM